MRCSPPSTSQVAHLRFVHRVNLLSIPGVVALEQSIPKKVPITTNTNDLILSELWLIGTGWHNDMQTLILAKLSINIQYVLGCTTAKLYKAAHHSVLISK